MTTEKEIIALDKAISKADTLAEKYTLEYYKDHNPNDKYGTSGMSVTVMMEIEEFTRWLEKTEKLSQQPLSNVRGK
jgi:helix-turn-helix protein